MNEQYITKNAMAMQQIAKDFICTDIGNKIKTISQYQNKIGVARGTIQNSIKALTNSKAVELESRGQLGTYILDKDLSLLLKYSNIHFLVGVMPLPYSKKYEGLSTAILKLMEDNFKVPVNMAYMRGAQRRIEMVLNGRYDFAIMSKFAAKKHKKNYRNIELVMEFGPGSYLSNHVIMFNNDKYNSIEDGMKIGIDHDSIDQTELTLSVTKNKKVDLVEIEYNQLVEELRNKNIDAAVWNGDEAKVKNPNIHTKEVKLENDDNTTAVLIINSDRPELKKLIIDTLDAEKVVEIQQAVVDGKIIPSY